MDESMMYVLAILGLSIGTTIALTIKRVREERRNTALNAFSEVPVVQAPPPPDAEGFVAVAQTQCGGCGSLATYIDKYDMFYCHACQEYL